MYSFFSIVGYRYLVPAFCIFWVSAWMRWSLLVVVDLEARFFPGLIWSYCWRVEWGRDASPVVFRDMWSLLFLSIYRCCRIPPFSGAFPSFSLLVVDVDTGYPAGLLFFPHQHHRLKEDAENLYSNIVGVRLRFVFRKISILLHGPYIGWRAPKRTWGTP